MNRRDFMVCAGSWIAPLSASAQNAAAKVYRIGWLSPFVFTPNLPGVAIVADGCCATYAWGTYSTAPVSPSNAASSCSGPSR